MRKVITFLLFEYFYFFFLAIIVPTFTVSTPSWLEEGTYAEYKWETREGPYGNLTSWGFHFWKVTTIDRKNGTIYCLVNETWLSFNLKDNKEYHKSSILKVKPDRGYWLTNYYNEYIFFSACFIGDAKYIRVHTQSGSVLRFTSIGTMHLNNTSVIYLETCNIPNPLSHYSSETFKFDIGSGVLLQRDSITANGMISSHEKIISTNIPLTSSWNFKKSLFDLIQLTPFVIVPLVIFRQDIRDIASIIRVRKTSSGDINALFKS